MTQIVHRGSWLPSMFDDFFDTNFMPRANATAPAINVIEHDDDYTVELAAPGLQKDDFNVSIDAEGNLSIKMEKKSNQQQEDKKGHYLRREFSYSKYEQSLVLPEDVKRDDITAKVTDGVLTVVLPKMKQEETKVTRQISVD